MVMCCYLCLAKSPDGLNPDGPDLVIGRDERQVHMRCGRCDNAIRHVRDELMILPPQFNDNKKRQ
jgi:hypothetical protein